MSRFFIDDISVFFPYKSIYPEQLEYMREIKQTLDSPGHSILQMPTGTGKTVCLLAMIVSYLLQKQMPRKLIYCTRTVVEMEKTLEELKFLMSEWKKENNNPPDILAVCLSSRRNLCIHPKVSTQSDRERVDSACRSRTAPWVRQKYTLPDIEDLHRQESLCSFYETLHNDTGYGSNFLNGVFTLDDLKKQGLKHNYCPYFLARKLIPLAQIVVFNYSYVLDPKISELVSKQLRGNQSVVVFDECHNIDNVCVEALSMHIDRRSVEMASKNIDSLIEHLSEKKMKGSEKLLIEYESLVKGMSAKGQISSENQASLLAIPAQLSQNNNKGEEYTNFFKKQIKQAMPGNIRRAEHFLSFMRRIIAFLRQKLSNINEAIKQTPLAFVFQLQHVQAVDQKALKFAAQRLQLLMNTLQIESVYDYASLELIANFSTTLSIHQNGFAIIQDPFPNPNGVHDPIIQLVCLDASLATKPVFNRYRNVVLTSGTISPFDIYKTILQIKPKICRTLPPQLPRQCFAPILVSRGTDQGAVSSKFDQRDDASIVRNYGALLTDLAATVPDGIIAFFPSYLYMERILCRWHEMGVLQRLLKKKLLFVEKKDIIQTVLALESYRKACDCGRGAIFLSIARGKVAEGVDFAHHYGRCVVLFGVPFQYSLSRPLRARLDFMKQTYGVSEKDFLAFDAMRQAAQCLGRVIRSKSDYGLMVLADKRYSRSQLVDKLPEWIRNKIGEEQKNVSTYLAVAMAKDFFKQMCQPFVISKKILLDSDAVNQKNQQYKKEKMQL